MVLLSVRLLGELSAVDYRGDALSVGNRRTQALIIYLALKIDSKTSMAEMSSLLFGDANAEGEVREVVRDLHYALRYLPHDILIDDGTLRFNRETVEVDARVFEQLIGAPSMNSIRKAVEIYRGNLLENFVSGIQPFDEWLGERRLTYWRAALAIFGNLLTTQIRAGWWEEAVETAGRLLSLDPSQEVVHRTLMRLQLEQGRADSALRRYQECADVLHRDYNRDPAPETQRLHTEILRALEQTPAPREVAHARPDGPVLVLVVEDDLVSSALIEGYLAEAAYEVVTVADGGDALIELGRRHFDLLILDINIPTLSGLKVFEIMLQKGIDIPALFITGMSGTDVEMQSLEMGAAGFLRKPIRKEVLLPKIRGILQRKQRGSASQ
jgi:CheY-like chemotaxis protein